MSTVNKFTRRDFNQFLEIQRNQIIDLEICISNIKSIIRKDDAQSDSVSLVREFIGHYVSLAYSYAALTICKLFGDNEKQSIIKLLNKLEYCKLSKELLLRFEESDKTSTKEKIIVTKGEIKVLVAELRELINDIQPKIDHIINRRNTFYAHSDPNNKFLPEKLSEIDEINRMAQTIFNKLNKKFKASTVFFENIHWTIDTIFD